jgi:predicted ABC-type ATPase
MPFLYIIAGCNGAGKTTASYTVLPEMLDCKEFVNADEIAKGLSPFQPETVAFEAGRIMLHRIKELIRSKVDFAFETTLSTKSYRPLIVKAKAEGYKVVMIYFWLESAELAKQRVKNRVKKGGHNIPEEVIERRYNRGMQNLFKFIPLLDHWTIWDNSEGAPSIIAQGNQSVEIEVYNDDIWESIKSHESGRD